ncbi:MAG TPA: GNAT family N-acetyltransferase [Polyangia bacterium]|nr:GNAT family N-acetyltransferase [Polyangia bacterium]
MEPLDLAAFDAVADEYDRAVARSRDLDHFCSSSAWILPAHEALMPPREPWLRRGEHGWVALARAAEGNVRYLQPLEAMWGLASPLVGAGDGGGPGPGDVVEVCGLAAEFAAACFADAGWNLLLLSGVLAGAPLFQALLERFGRRCRLGLGPVTSRYVASLDGGLDGFLSRRSANFRHAVGKAVRRAAGLGVTVEPLEIREPGAALAAYERLLQIERCSWKGQEGVGIDQGAMHEFYRLMLPRLARRGALRLMFARHEERDVGYILGGALGRTYRGLQFSFDDSYARHSLGNVMQYHQIAALCEEGVMHYDLGAEVEYKRRWAEPGLETVTLVVARGR